MKTYVAFLRGINVAGQKKIKMTDLKNAVRSLGVDNVFTYIQSGNVVFDAEIKNLDDFTISIEERLHEIFNEQIKVLLIEDVNLEKILQNHPMAFKGENKKTYYTMLFSSPSKEALESLSKEAYSKEQLSIGNKVIYGFFTNGYGKAKYNNNYIEKKLKVLATTRNFNTLNNILLKIKQNQF
ncbi:MAG: DUF1697 domain-containing protein [Vicingaceae bacterium]